MLFRTSIQTIWLTLCAIWLSLLLTLLLLEVHVSMVHDSTGKLVDAHLLIGIEAMDVNRHVRDNDNGDRMITGIQYLSLIHI